MIHTGENFFEGVRVEVTRKRTRRINLRIDAHGAVKLSVPFWGATLKDAEEFLRRKWQWVLETRAKALANPPPAEAAVTDAEKLSLAMLLAELNAVWSERLSTGPVAWKIRKMKTLWGSCHWRKRVVTYNAELARAPRELVEYVVVHELTHFDVHDHGPRFAALMDARLPAWRELRRRLNKREFR